QTMSSCEGATLWRYQSRYRRSPKAGVRAQCCTNHNVRAAARTNRKVLAPTTRSRLRHWSWPNPATTSAIPDGDFYGPPLAILGEDGAETRRESCGEQRLHHGQRLALAGLTGAGLMWTAHHHHHADQPPWQHAMPQPGPGLDERPGLRGMGLPAGSL